MVSAILLGASRGVALYATLNLLSSSSNKVTLLLRKPSTFEEDADVKALFVRQPDAKQRLTIVQGDATNEADLTKLFQQAGNDVELIVNSIGGAPAFKFPMTVEIVPPRLTENVMRQLLPHVRQLGETRSSQGLKAPRLVTVSSMGLGSTHKELPMALRFMYSALLQNPHDDKMRMEAVLRAATGKKDADLSSVTNDIELEQHAWLEDFVVVRPGFFTDGAQKGVYRAAPRVVPNAWTISRRDVGHFIATSCLPGNDTWKGTAVVVAY